MQDLTIIISVFNGADTISEALESIKESVVKYGAVLLIYDAKSTDETVSKIENCNIKNKLVCEKDDGLYHAWNKAVEDARSDFIFFLNADDKLVSTQNLKNLLASLREDPRQVAAYGTTKMLRKDGKVSRRGNQVKKRKFYGEMPIVTPACIFKRQAVIDIGKFNCQFQIAADYDMVQRLLLKHGPGNFIHHKNDIVDFALTGMSNMQTIKVDAELNEIVRKNYTLSGYLKYQIVKKYISIKRTLLNWYLNAKTK